MNYEKPDVPPWNNDKLPKAVYLHPADGSPYKSHIARICGDNSPGTVYWDLDQSLAEGYVTVPHIGRDVDLCVCAYRRQPRNVPSKPAYAPGFPKYLAWDGHLVIADCKHAEDKLRSAGFGEAPPKPDHSDIAVCPYCAGKANAGNK